MTERPNGIPKPVSIQTGNNFSKKLQPISEEKQDINLKEPDYLCGEFCPPPIMDTEIVQTDHQIPPINDVGNYGEFDTPKNQGVSFDHSSSISSMKQDQGGYNIIDLMWLLNPKFREELIPEEAQVCVLSFNINFGNIKVTLYKIPNGALVNHVIFLMKLQRLTSGTLYPSSLFKLLNTLPQEDVKGNNVGQNFTCIEQLIHYTGEQWQFNRPMCSFQVDKEKITLRIVDPKSGEFYYTFEGWQRKALLHAANFATTQGYILTGQRNIRGG